jgi:small GTP-binding protein
MFKLILIGDSSVGKSCLLTRLTEDFFKSESDPTIGVEFGTKVLKSSSGLNVRIQVWDTAGQENFRSITQSYYRGAIGAFIVFDLTQRKSYENVGKWIKDAR